MNILAIRLIEHTEIMTLELRRVKITLGDQSLFSPLSLVINPGELRTIMGDSGCGKSTLLAAICGNLSGVFTLNGEVLLNGKEMIPIPMEKRRIGILFQDDLLFPHLNISENLAFAIPAGNSKRQKKEKITTALKSAGLAGFEKRDPATLSGGQRARVSLFRSLLAEPQAILLDEPFSKLDQQLKGQIREFVFDTIQKMNIPALLVTHDPQDCPGNKFIDLSQNRSSDVGISGPFSG